MPLDIAQMIKQVLAGHSRTLSKTISLIENEADQAMPLLDALYKYTGNAYRIGITGPPGAGKSTLVSLLAEQFSDQGKTVGIIAVDPTSPFSGGAILGDRIRMEDLSKRKGIFIRSMAIRNHFGGLSKSAKQVADVLDAAGKNIIIFETVGVGQSELDVARAADTTVVVLVPESGDGVQVMKAGLLEIAEVLVVNKADRENAGLLANELDQMLNLREAGWRPPVIKSIAIRSEGIQALGEAIASHRDFLMKENRLQNKRRQRLVQDIQELVEEGLRKSVLPEKDNLEIRRQIDAVLSKKTSPYRLSEVILQKSVS